MSPAFLATFLSRASDARTSTEGVFGPQGFTERWTFMVALAAVALVALVSAGGWARLSTRDKLVE